VAKDSIIYKQDLMSRGKRIAKINTRSNNPLLRKNSPSPNPLLMN